MNKNTVKTIGSIFIALLMLSMIPAFSNAKYPAVSMWLDPDAVDLDTSSETIGYQFDITVWVNATGANVAGWQFEILYNKAYLKTVSCVYTGTGGAKSQLMEAAGATTIPVSPTLNAYYDATRNYTLHGESWMSGPYGTGVGSLSKVKFEVIATPPKGGDIIDLIDIKTECNPPAGKTYLLDDTTTEILLKANVHNCDYTFDWIMPPNPQMAVIPTTWEGGFYDNVTGELIDVDVYINGLDAAWYLVNASFKLHYDSLLLAVDSCVIDTGSWDVSSSCIIVDGTMTFVVETSQVLSGNVKVADITFEIIYQGIYPTVNVSTLTFSDVILWDHEIEIGTLDPIEGEITIIGFVALPMPYLEVVPPETVLGPEPSLGEEFTVDVVMKDLYADWNLIGYDFRLSYCNDLLEVVEVIPGDFLDQTSWGKIVLEDVTVPAAEAPLWVGQVYVLLKVVTENIGDYTFTIEAPADIITMIDGALANSFTVSSVSPPMVTWKLIELRTYKTYAITGDYTISVTPATYGVHMALTGDISYYWALDWNNTIYPTWWDWLNGTVYESVYYPHHWDWMDWYVTEGSLTTKAFEDIWDCTGEPLLYNDTGAGDYYCFRDNLEMCDPDLMDIHNDPDIDAVIPWIRNKATPPPSITVSNVYPVSIYGPHVSVGGLVLSDTGEWYIFPEGEGVLVTIKFRAIKQGYEDLKCNFTLFDIEMIDPDEKGIPYKDPVNGTYTMLGFDLPGRQIDLYTQYPAPYGGQGPNNPSDMFWPQKEVILYANVTYNYWPVQHKIVAYEIIDSEEKVWDKMTAITDEYGVAEVRFRMPWPCDDPESLFGAWSVIATVDIACIVINDTLQFHYDYLTNIFKVTTDIECAHGDTVTIDIDLTSHAMQTYTVLVTVAIRDELGYTVGFASVEILIGGAQFCTPKEYEVRITIDIPKYAAAGLATVHVNCFDKEPSEGGVALCPEYTPPPEIFIMPY